MQVGNHARGLPVRLSMDLPAGWDYKESFTVLDPERRANVILSSEPVDPSMTTEEYAALQSDSLETEFPGYNEIALEDFALGEGGHARIRFFEWSPPDADDITQAQIYYVDRARGCTATATARTTDFDEFRGALLDILHSIVVAAEPVEEAPPE